MKIIKIELIVAGFLGSSKSTKNGTEIIKREYINSITVREVLADAKIKLRFIGLIMLNGKNTNQDFLINYSCRIKLYPLLGGG